MILLLLYKLIPALIIDRSAPPGVLMLACRHFSVDAVPI